MEQSELIRLWTPCKTSDYVFVTDATVDETGSSVNSIYE